MWLRPGSAYTGYDKQEFASFLSEEERKECRETEHWLAFVRSAHDELSARAAINSFLVALWVAKPTLTHATLRFEEPAAGASSVARILDRFHWIRGYAAKEVKDNDLGTAEESLTAHRTSLSRAWTTDECACSHIPRLRLE